jgi:hypothetical protein
LIIRDAISGRWRRWGGGAAVVIKRPATTVDVILRRERDEVARASKDGSKRARCHPSRLAALAPQDDVEFVSHTLRMRSEIFAGSG